MRLASREKHYQAQDVREDVILAGNRTVAPTASVWCFTGSSTHRGSAGSEAVVILDDYVQKVLNAAAHIDGRIAEAIDDSLVESRFLRMQGPYKFVDEVQASLA